jgi:Lamin Tail Domain
MNTRTAGIGAATTALVVASAIMGSAPAEAASPVQFGKIQYDSPGSDTGANAHVNAEYVIVRNAGTRAATLTGWTVRDKQNHVYTFGTFSLGAGKTVVLRTGKGTNTATTRFWGSSYYIWNNTGDSAYLRNSAGANMDSCVWTTTAPGYKNC